MLNESFTFEIFEFSTDGPSLDHRWESVTASSGTAISTDMFRNFVKNSFKFDVALKHAQDEVPARKSTPENQKTPLATNKHRRRLERHPQRMQNTV